MLIPADKARRRRVPATKSASADLGGEMGLVYAEIEIISGDDLALHRRGYIAEEQIKRLTVRASVDSGAYMLAINRDIKEPLDLMALGTHVEELADKTLIKLDVAGPIEIRFANRRAGVDAVVLPDNAEALRGAIPMEEMDVSVDPKREQLVVNPSHPTFAEGSLK